MKKKKKKRRSFSILKSGQNIPHFGLFLRIVMRIFMRILREFVFTAQHISHRHHNTMDLPPSTPPLAERVASYHWVVAIRLR